MAAIAAAIISVFLFSSPLLISASTGEEEEVIPHHAPINVADAPKYCLKNDLQCEIQQMKLKVSQLELSLEVKALAMLPKTLYVDKYEKKSEEMSRTIQQLEANLSKMKGLPDFEESITALEKEAQELEVLVRKNEEEIQMLKIKTEFAENQVKWQAAVVEKMSKIGTELWLHVQKLEQAREVIERRTAEFLRHRRNQRCSFFKFINNLPGRQYQKMASDCMSKAVDQLRRSFSAGKKYHHELQGVIRQEMEKNELTAVLVNEEVIFVMASLAIVIPIMFAFLCLAMT